MISTIISYKNAGEVFSFSVEKSAPYKELSLFVETAVDTFTEESEDAISVVHSFIKSVNDAMKNVAIYGIIHNNDIFKALSARVTYGAYSVKDDDGKITIENDLLSMPAYSTIVLHSAK